MSRESTLKRILDGGIVAVVRSETSEPLVNVVEALARGGVTAAEVTFTVPDAIDVIRQVRRQVGDSVVLGAGTVLDSETARAAILAGAEYIVSPIVNLDVIRLCRRYDKVVMPGAFTPTEVVSAWEAGADVVKVFPADVGGPPYLKALRASPSDPTDAHRRCRSVDGRSLPQCRCVLPGRRKFAGRPQGDRQWRFRADPRTRGRLHRDRPTIARQDVSELPRSVDSPSRQNSLCSQPIF